MKKPLNLRIEEKLIIKAKKMALDKKTSVSNLFEDWIKKEKRKR